MTLSRIQKHRRFSCRAHKFGRKFICNGYTARSIGITRRWMVLLLLGFATSVGAAQPQTVRIGAKNFTEQELLGELVAQLIERHTDLKVQRRFGLGGSDICHAALVGGELDLYVEYTGTALLNILKYQVIHNGDEAFSTVAKAYRDRYDLEWLPPIGFNNTYTITVRSATADELDLTTISDLRPRGGQLSGGFTSEFMERPDGYPGLHKLYGFKLNSTVDLEPGLMYQAVAQEQVDVICAFATDGRLTAYDLRVLDDDQHFFPPYDAAPIVRGELLRNHPEIRDALVALAGTICDDDMRQMNHAVDVLKQEPADVVRRWLNQREGQTSDHSRVASGDELAPKPSSFWALALERKAEIGQKTLEHLILTVLGMLIAIALGVPIGVIIHRNVPARGPVLGAIEVVQTIPSLAMLAFLFAVYGLLGTIPAVTALVFYALLPIVLNTFTGLCQVPPQVIQAADGVGMSSGQRLWMVELPLAVPVTIAGIRAATVLTVGIATLCTYIGAGGLGDFIARGLARNDPRLTLLGAVPAAIMAVTLSLLIRLMEKSTRTT